MSDSTKRRRRTPQEQIADLEAKIAQVKERAKRQALKKDPTLKHINSAIRAIDKATSECSDKPTKTALQEARGILAACGNLSGGDAAPVMASANLDRAEILEFVRNHPGCRCSEVAAEFGVDSKSVSPYLKELRNEGEVRTEGQARGMRYF